MQSQGKRLFLLWIVTDVLMTGCVVDRGCSRYRHTNRCTTIHQTCVATCPQAAAPTAPTEAAASQVLMDRDVPTGTTVKTSSTGTVDSDTDNAPAPLNALPAEVGPTLNE